MGAPSKSRSTSSTTMSQSPSKQTTGLKKFFGRKPKSSKPTPTISTNKSPPKRRSFWGGSKKDNEPIENSSGSSEDVPMGSASKYDETTRNFEEKISSIRLVEDGTARRSSLSKKFSESNSIAKSATPRQTSHTTSSRIASSSPVNSVKKIESNVELPKSIPSPKEFLALDPNQLSSMKQKQLIKERDGFCRRVDTYDGSVIRVEGAAAYELGNYLGGGVAGVVYEGHRLLSEDHYPVRQSDHHHASSSPTMPTPQVVEVKQDRVHSLLSCVPGGCQEDNTQETTVPVHNANIAMTRDAGSLLTTDSHLERAMADSLMGAAHTDTVALEAVNDGMGVLIDTQDAPSRSAHYANAVVTNHQNHATNTTNNNTSKPTIDIPSDASFTNNFMEETVAIKILNPVGFRALAVDVTNQAVVARAGAALTAEISRGEHPMEERHVWWLINPSSRNLRTLQRYKANDAPRGVEVDRGSPDKGLRISLIAAYKDREDGLLKELPLTRCIEIWGHVPFESSDAEFRQVMLAIDRINQGLPPPAIAVGVPGRIATATSSLVSQAESLNIPSPMASKRTGIYRAAATSRKTVYCEDLQAYIALPSVPSKYLKWLRQRRAATKEIRNMMLIGRHRNVVHLFEVLELIQETKSTMFLILELVRGGELFDLISSNAAKISSKDVVPSGFTESETVMRKFFMELSSGIHYCHENSIAHRDLKPENLLVHNGLEGNCTLKIADFGLSAAFGPNGESVSDQDTAVETYVSGPPAMITGETPPLSPPTSPIKQQVDKLLGVGSTALGFLTCGNVEDIISCGPTTAVDNDVEPSPLKRMTSVVGSPHYVAPEIISQNDKRGKLKSDMGLGIPAGYDGTKADVWSAGVILYAMLFRSLPFGEDLLRCPRYQSFKKWYDDVKKSGGRRSDIMAPLNPVISELEDQEFLGPHWFFPSESSPESRDLIVYMLNPDPDQRPSIQLVLQHPWLLKMAS